MKRILTIGNSFSEDATTYFKKIATSAGVDLHVVNLYIGGCTLEMHAKNIAEDNAAYRFEVNGVYSDRMISIREALLEEEWDIVTVQQESGNSGVYESYGDYIKQVLNFVKSLAPQAKIYFHHTWAYEIDTIHPAFEKNYGRDQAYMHRCITETVERICKENGNLPIIPCGRVIDEVRKDPAFDYKNGGQSLCREDGFHMHLVYGRYLTAAVWFETLLGGNIYDATFVPKEEDLINGYSMDNFSCDVEKLEIIKSYVYKA